MESTLQNPGPIQAILITLLGIALTVGILTLVFRQVSVKKIKATDGTLFNSEEACKEYEIALNKLNPLYKEDSKNLDKAFGFSEGFLNLLKTTGFNDVKVLLKYKSDLQNLVKLFD